MTFIITLTQGNPNPKLLTTIWSCPYNQVGNVFPEEVFLVTSALDANQGKII